MITFACVWVGPGSANHAPYDETWIQKLQNAIGRHYKGEHRFVCLTDREHIDGVETIKLEHNWPVYWSKLELFKPGQFDGPVIYMDLDVLITGDITEFATPRDSIVMLTDYYPEIANSTLLYWDASDPFYHGLYEDMVANPAQVQHNYRNRPHITNNFGDQEYIADFVTRNGRNILRWQEILPRDWFVEFSFTSRLNPVVRDQKYSDDIRFCYCLGSPKFQRFPNMHIVRDHWK